MGSQHSDTLQSMNNLATTYYAQGKYALAEPLFRQTLEDKRRAQGLEHPVVLTSMDTLADVYEAEGKHEQAMALFRQTLEISRRVLGPEHPVTLAILADSAFAYQRQGNYAMAQNQAAEVLAGRRHVLGSEHPDTIASVMDLALADISEGKFVESEPLTREAAEFGKAKQPDDWQRFRAESLLGASLAGEKKYSKAEPLLMEGYKGMLARKDRIDVPDWYHLNLAREWLVRHHQAWGKSEKAVEWTKR